MELLERQAALADLARLAHQARDGQGGTVPLSGEAGVGAVDHHVSAVLTKLGAPTRAAAVARSSRKTR